ncbi:MAG: hypothetical protein WAU01_14445 [Saprospiraceae bacterium]
MQEYIGLLVVASSLRTYIIRHPCLNKPNIRALIIFHHFIFWLKPKGHIHVPLAKASGN